MLLVCGGLKCLIALLLLPSKCYCYLFIMMVLLLKRNLNYVNKKVFLRKRPKAIRLGGTN